MPPIYATINSQQPRRWLTCILIAGLLLRALIWIFGAPNTDDDHFAIIRWMVHHHAIPYATQYDDPPNSIPLSQAYHPPLYYLLATPLFKIFGTHRGVGLLSFALSVFSLLLLYRLISFPDLIPDPPAKMAALGLVAFLPPFVLFSNYVSNDSLSFALGIAITSFALLYIRNPSFKNQLLLALLLGLGLLTKGTFLAYIPVLLALVVIRHDSSPRFRRAFRLLLFLIVFAVLGSYKYLQNDYYYGHFFIHNLGLEESKTWRDHQIGTYAGPSSLFNVNVLSLVPLEHLDDDHLFGPNDPRHSIPLLYYATFWHQLIHESNFHSRLAERFVVPVLFFAAILPTFLIFLGMLRIASTIRCLLIPFSTLQSQISLFKFFCLTLFLSEFSFVTYVGLHYDVWTCFHSRLFFSAIFSIALFLAEGFMLATRLLPRLKAWLFANLMTLYGLCLSSLALSCASVVWRYWERRHGGNP